MAITARPVAITTAWAAITISAATAAAGTTSAATAAAARAITALGASRRRSKENFAREADLARLVDLDDLHHLRPP